MKTALQPATLHLPQADIPLAQTIARRMGWVLQPIPSAIPAPAKDTSNTRHYSERITRLRALSGTGITQEDLDNDPRLAYLLSK